MELRELLEIRRGVTALIGGGGKTAAMYVLARELTALGTVVCCTTTHIRPPDHLPVLEGADEGALAAALAERRCVCLGERCGDGKLTAPALGMEAPARLADYVLVEADGSRGLPVKAHLAHEPVIPPQAGNVVALVGASGFGQPVREAVHRWEVFRRLTGAGPEEPVTAENVAALLKCEGLGDRIFVNQADGGIPPSVAALAERADRPVSAGSLRGGTWICLS